MIHPKEILFRYDSLLPAFYFVSYLLIMLVFNPYIHRSLGFAILLLPSVFHSSIIVLEFCYFTSLKISQCCVRNSLNFRFLVFVFNFLAALCQKYLFYIQIFDVLTPFCT